MRFIKKHSFLIFGLGIIILFFLTRLYNILALPIFTDEAIYIRWAQIAGTDAAQRFISLTDGKQPLFIWIAAIFIKVINDPLLAGRLVSVFSGLFTTIGIYFLAQELFKDKKVALVASFLYVIYPFALVYDKLAVYDSFLAVFAVWSLYLEVLLVRYRRLDLAFVTAMIIGAGLLTKSSALFFLYLIPFSLLLFDFKAKEVNKKLLKWVGLSLVVVVFSYAYYSVLRLSQFFYIINEKNYTFIYPINDWIRQPFAFLPGNIRGLTGWAIDYLTIPIVLLVILAFFINRKFIREKLLLFAWFILPFIALALFGKVIYPRFIFFMTLPLLILASYTLVTVIKKIKSRNLKIFVFLAFIFLMLGKDYYLLQDFSKAPIPSSDRAQLIESWPAGGGVKETVDFLKEKSKDQKIYVGTEGTFGLMPYALEIYLHDNPNVRTQGFWPITDTPPVEILEQAAEIPTYFVFYQPCPSCKQVGTAPVSWPVKEIFQIEKLEKGSFYTLYQVMPQ